MSAAIAMSSSTKGGPGNRSSWPVAMKRPSANSRVSPGRIGKNSPHSTKTMTRLIQNSSVPKRSSSQLGSIQSMPSSTVDVTRPDGLQVPERLTRATLDRAA